MSDSYLAMSDSYLALRPDGELVRPLLVTPGGMVKCGECGSYAGLAQAHDGHWYENWSCFMKTCPQYLVLITA